IFLLDSYFCLLTCLPYCSIFSSLSPCSPISTLFPYTTLFRSGQLECYESDRKTGGSFSCTLVWNGSSRQGYLLPYTSWYVHNTGDRKSTRLNSSHVSISYAVFCVKKKIMLHLYFFCIWLQSCS